MNRCVLVVEDDPKIATTLKLYLEREGYRVKVTDNGRAALKEARELQPALILLDLMLPQLSGTNVCRILRRESDVYIIMLTARTTEADKLRGLDLGADDYVSKPFSPRELMARVRAVLRRQREHLPPKHPEMRINGLRINFEHREVFLNERLTYLTPAEFRLLEAFVRAPERVFTRQELVARAFGHDYDALDRTIDAHIMNLRKKLEMDRERPSLIVTVYGVGYKLSAQQHVS